MRLLKVKEKLSVNIAALKQQFKGFMGFELCYFCCQFLQALGANESKNPFKNISPVSSIIAFPLYTPCLVTSFSVAY
jgi:hypothetical protein